MVLLLLRHRSNHHHNIFVGPVHLGIVINSHDYSRIFVGVSKLAKFSIECWTEWLTIIFGSILFLGFEYERQSRYITNTVFQFGKNPRLFQLKCKTSLQSTSASITPKMISSSLQSVEVTFRIVFLTLRSFFFVFGFLANYYLPTFIGCDGYLKANFSSPVNRSYHTFIPRIKFPLSSRTKK